MKRSPDLLITLALIPVTLLLAGRSIDLSSAPCMTDVMARATGGRMHSASRASVAGW